MLRSLVGSEMCIRDRRKSVLIVTGTEPLRAARNLAGVDAVAVNQLNTEPVSYTHLTLPTIYSV